MEAENRYARQLILPEIGEEGQRKLAGAKVLIVGVGGLGSPIALYLAGAGVGTIGLIDDDVVSTTNLQRQVLYSQEWVDRCKVFCARDRIQALNPTLNVKAYPVRLSEGNATFLIEQFDIVVDGSDNFDTRYLLDEVCGRLKKPFVYGAIRELSGQVSVFHWGDHSSSFRDLFPDKEEMFALPPPPKGVVGVTPGIVGAVEAGEVLKLICGYGEPMSGKLWTIDLRTLETHILAF